MNQRAFKIILANYKSGQALIEETSLFLNVPIQFLICTVALASLFM